ncbi:Uncharacterised protein [Mycobacteroides abscessus subsp. massiliense]|nr:Uncharacterised protein [Mycobacteroides abscessus subsp. massiliense]
MLVAGGVIAAGLTGLLVGCDVSDRRTNTTDPDLTVAHIDVDHIPRTCVVYRDYQKGGLSCDWSKQ